VKIDTIYLSSGQTLSIEYDRTEVKSLIDRKIVTDYFLNDEHVGRVFNEAVVAYTEKEL
jgi:hypothetical protein